MVSNTHEARNALSRVLSALQDAETGQRGFLLTGDALYLEPYTKAIKGLEHGVEEALQLTSGNPDQQQLLRQAKPLIDEKLMELSETITLFKDEGPEAAINLVATDAGKRLMDRLRIILAEMKSNEDALLEEREFAFQKNKILAQAVALIGFVLLLMIGTLVVVRTRSLLHSRDETEWQLRQAKAEADDANEELSVLAKDLENRVELRTRELSEAIDTERRLFRAIEQSPSMVMITDTEGNIDYANPKLLDFMGYETSDLIGRNPRIFKSGETSLETYEDLWQTIKSGNDWSGEIKNRRRNGDLIWSNLVISPVKDKSGKITHFVSTYEDLTERHEAERALRQTQKMESLGSLSGGMAHDINNMLVPIINLTTSAIDTLPEDRIERKRLGSVIKAAEQVKSLVEKIPAFSRQEKSKLEVVDVSEMLQETTDLIRSTMPSSVDLKLEADKNLEKIYADKTQISSVVINLASNSFDAMEGGTGELKISAARAKINKKQAKKIHNLEAGHYVKLTVSDNGPGIKDEILRRVFDPFFTTKAVGKGTGMGLAMAYGIVSSHGGMLELSSALGEGTTAAIYLPQIEGGGFFPTVK